MKLEPELWKFLFCFLTFFAADISKKALKDSSLVKFSLLKWSFLVKTQLKITRGGVCRVYGSTKRFEIANMLQEQFLCPN